MNHLARTAEMWKVFLKNDVTEASLLDIDFLFVTKSKDAVEKIISVLSDYKFKVSSKGFFRNEYLLESSSGAIAWDEEQLLKWVDYLIQVGNETGCKFDGCGASIG